jgi:hypothetical protein
VVAVGTVHHVAFRARDDAAQLTIDLIGNKSMLLRC